MSLEFFDHPLLFLIALTIGVVAMSKLLAYASGTVGLTTLQNFFVGGNH